MQTILGASGQLGRKLVVRLKRGFTDDIQLVSRNPKKVNDGDRLHKADLIDAGDTLRAAEGSEIVYLTAGLPMDARLRVEHWPVIMRNVIDACAAQNARLAFFDNTYMYPQTAGPQREDLPFRPHGEKGRIRAAIARDPLRAIPRRFDCHSRRASQREGWCGRHLMDDGDVDSVPIIHYGENFCCGKSE